MVVCVDVKDIKVVVNFDMPNNAEDYVHRIGECLALVVAVANDSCWLMVH